MNFSTDYLLGSIEVTKSWLKDPAQVNEMENVVHSLVKTFSNSGKLIAFGNGGSAAEASHLVGEVVGKCKKDNGAWPAISLNDSSTNLTCIANDWDFSMVFIRQLEALVQPYDFVIALSTSGKSKNVIKALEYCVETGIQTALFSSIACPKENQIATFNILAPTYETTFCQELHLQLIHLLSLELEKILKK